MCKQIKRLISDSDDIVILTGSRSLEGINFIKDYFSVENSQIIYIYASFEQLKRNYETLPTHSSLFV